jgi:hypothetical protein
VRSTRLTKAARRELVREFLAAAWPEETPSARLRSSRLRTARQVAQALVDFGTDEGPEDPLRCTPVTLEACLLHELPRELGPALEADEAVAIVRRWIDFTGARTSREPALTARLVQELDDLAAQLRELLETERSAERALTAAMQADGVDMADPDAVGDWLRRFDRLPRSRQERILAR